MSRRLLCLFVLFSSSLFLNCAAPPAVPGEGPHVVIITVDSLRPDHMGIYGYERETTPNLGRLARHAVVYENAFAAHTRTGPSHATILSGLYPQTHGAVRDSHQMRQSARTLTSVLKDRGYRTGGFISSYPLPRRFMNLDQAFDTYDDRVDSSEGVRRDEQALEPALRWLERNQEGTPTFLFLQLSAPTQPYHAPGAHGLRFLDDARTQYRMPERPERKRLSNGKINPGEVEEYVARYDAEIAYMDATVEKLWKHLRELGYWDNTLFLLVGSHGETLEERRWKFDHGGRVYEEQISIPLLIRMPGDEHTGKRVDSMAHHIDVYPTVLDFLGIRSPEERRGRSLLRPMSNDESGIERPLFSLARPNPKTVPEIQERLAADGLVTSVRQYPWKLIAYPTLRGGEYRQLFNLRDDPRELKDLAETYPQVVRDLSERLNGWWEQTTR